MQGFEGRRSAEMQQSSNTGRYVRPDPRGGQTHDSKLILLLGVGWMWRLFANMCVIAHES